MVSWPVCLTTLSRSSYRESSLDAVAYCSLFLLTGALLLTSSHSEGVADCCNGGSVPTRSGCYVRLCLLPVSGKEATPSARTHTGCICVRYIPSQRGASVALPSLPRGARHQTIFSSSNETVVVVVVVVVVVAVAVVVVVVAVVVASNARSASRERDNVGNSNKRTCIRTRIRTPDSLLCSYV